MDELKEIEDFSREFLKSQGTLFQESNQSPEQVPQEVQTLNCIFQQCLQAKERNSEVQDPMYNFEDFYSNIDNDAQFSNFIDTIIV